MNLAACSNGRRGSFFELPARAATEPAAAESVLAGNEFIFDVQGHFVNPTGAWTRTLPPGARPLASLEKAGCGLGGDDGLGHLQCLGRDEFNSDIFLDSDTDLTVLSFVPPRARASR